MAPSVLEFPGELERRGKRSLSGSNKIGRFLFFSIR